MKEVLSTTNYNDFQQIVSNREVDPRHVKRMVKSIEKQNLLHLNPIIVNDRLEVVDGQHRLEAAQVLNVPIYYVIDGSIGKAQISQLNSVKKDWSMMDYINYWAIEKAPGFDKLSAFISEHPLIQPSTVLMLLSQDGTRNTEQLRNGQINVDNHKQAFEIAQYLKELRNICEFAYSRNFILAIYNIVNTGRYDHSRMMQKIEMQPRSLVKCINIRQYITLLEEIYNYRSHDQNKVSFRYGGGK